MPQFKHIVPSMLRDRMRPLYRKASNLVESTRKRLTPAPQEWRALRDELRMPHDSAALYHLSQKEFCTLQQEPEIVGVLDYVAAAKPTIIGEIGLKHSGNSFLFTQRFSEAELFVGLDLKLENTDKLSFIAPSQMQLRFFEGNSYAVDTVRKVTRLLNGRQFDFLFIDGDHSFDGVKEDFLQYRRLVRPGGLIGFHDIVPDEVARHGTKPVESNCYGGDVHRFWGLLKHRFQHQEFVNSWDQIGFGIGVIQTPNETISQADVDELRTYLVIDP